MIIKSIARAKGATLLRMAYIASYSADNGTTIGTNSTTKCFNHPATTADAYAVAGCRPYLGSAVSGDEVSSCHPGRAPPDKSAGLRAAKPLAEGYLSAVYLENQIPSLNLHCGQRPVTGGDSCAH